MKPWKDLTFADNYMFCKILEDEALCKELLEILLHIKVGKIIYNKTERQIEPGFGSRGIRMDVYLEESDKIYDIEMQTCNYSDLPLRVRYYQGAMDLAKVKKRSKVDELKETYILFICLNDPFNAELPVYTIKNMIKESPETLYNDKTHRVFYNCSAYKHEKNDALKGLLEYLSTNTVTTDFSRKLETSVTDAKINNDWEDSYMFLSGWIEDEIKNGIRDGIQKGIDQGIQQGIEQGIQQGIQKGIDQGIQQGMQKGIQQGIEQGIQQGKIEGIDSEKIRIAKELLNNKVSLNIIVQSTGLTEDFINNL